MANLIKINRRKNEGGLWISDITIWMAAKGHASYGGFYSQGNGINKGQKNYVDHGESGVGERVTKCEEERKKRYEIR